LAPSNSYQLYSSIQHEFQNKICEWLWVSKQGDRLFVSSARYRSCLLRRDAAGLVLDIDAAFSWFFRRESLLQSTG
jgi:hypothetical protein